MGMRRMTETELRPCPFCGKTPAYGKLLFGTGKFVYTVHCENCNFNIGWFEEKEKALKKWNTRDGVK